MDQLSGLDIAQAYAVRLMQHLVVPTFVLNSKREVIIWNRACERLTGVPANEVLGTTEHWKAFYPSERFCLADLLALDRPCEIADFYPEHCISDIGLGFSAENWCVMPRRGSQLYLAIDVGPIHDEHGNLIAVVETLRDMTDHKRAEAALMSLASSDGLTGLANRRRFDQVLTIERSRALRTKAPLSMIFADVDHFKMYNDLHGHQQGDDCLKQVASIIREVARRPTDFAARYGGEEFAIILPETDHLGAIEVADGLLASLAAARLKHGALGAAHYVTVSLGIATLPPGSIMSCDDLLKMADKALYEAKQTGRNCIRVADTPATLVSF